MAQHTNEQLSALDFAEVRPWTSMAASDQQQPAAYRQPKYRLTQDNHPDWVDQFEQLIHDRTNAGHQTFKYRIAGLISQGFNRIGYLKRMADSRNVMLRPTIPGHNDAPAPWNYGGNLTHPAQLRMLWHLSAILTYLFSPVSLYRLQHPAGLMDTYNWWSFINDGIAQGLLLECDKVYRLERDQALRLRRGLGTLRDEFKWIVPFERSLEDAYDSVAAAFNWAQGEGRDPDAAVRSALGDIPEMTRLLIILLEREKSFDDVVCQEHIFGALYDKRIRFFGTADLTFLWNHLNAGFRGDMENHWDIYQHLNGIYRQLTEYQERLKELFDYRYLMEWHWNKMWDRLYVVINPDLQISDQTIRKFVNWSTRNGQVAQNVFAVHPIASRDLEHEECSICLEGYTDDQHPIGMVIIRTLCGHLFHPQCLFAGWDVPSFWQNRCPLCRQSAGRLRDAIACRLAVTDVEFDEPGDNLLMANHYYEIVDDLVTAGDDIPHDLRADMQDAYWLRRVEEEVLRPLREDRVANRPSWESALGGSTLTG